jgi:lysophospholipase L1-like esterase
VSGQEDNPFGELRSTLTVEDQAERLTAPAEPIVAPAFPVPRKIAITLACAGVLFAVPYLVPGLAILRPLTPGISLLPKDEPAGTGEEVPGGVAPAPADSVGEAALPGETLDQQGRADELEGKGAIDARGPIAQAQKPRVPDAVDEGKAVRPIDDPSGKALEKFFDKLMRVENKEPGAIARILYYGDSIVASDFVTGKLRRLYQTRFGDAGHGYAIAANAFPGWFHIDVARKASKGWKTSRCIGPYADDGMYGLGCVSFTARKEGEWFSMGTADRDEWGRSVSRFELEYMAQPGGGPVDLILDGAKHATLPTDGASHEVKWHTVTVPDGPHTLEVRTTSEAPVRLFGMRTERDVPGVTLSALGITGARARFLDKQDDAHWKQVLAAAKPDLVILAFGSNEITDGMIFLDEKGQKSKTPMDDYESGLRKVMQQIEAACPQASTMLVGPPDMASKDESQGHSRPQVGVIVTRQKHAAKEEGWAFFDQFNAMGGSGSMWGWMKSGLGNPDMFHPTGSGGNVLGKMQYQAVMEAYEKHKAAKR